MERIGAAMLHTLDAERAHALGLRALNSGILPLPGPITSDRLKTEIAGLALPNPVGLAAGFDKNGRALASLGRSGFGFVEIGAATPRPQPGNARPRLFRLDADRAVINRFGFNNDGVEAIADRLRATRTDVPRGLNLGTNKDSADRAADYAHVLLKAGSLVDFATINVSSPNTEKLRDLQGSDALAALLDTVAAANARLTRPVPLFLKIAPDLDDAALAEIAKNAERVELSGIVATNTTLARPDLVSPHRDEAGGLSGAPLFAPSTRVLAKLSTLTDLPLVGVGGVASAEDAYAKIRAGARAVQLYTGMVFGGITLVAEIARGLDALLERDGFATVADAVGTDRDRWL